MTAKKPNSIITINGWAIFAHPLFLNQLNMLIKQVETQQQKDPANYQKKNCTKRLAAISNLIFDIIPQDPTRPEYRQGDTLGEEHKHWFRAKFFQQYRLFFATTNGAKLSYLRGLTMKIPNEPMKVMMMLTALFGKC